ncbi:MAG: hemerythrin domain-containing protein [Rhizobacter sp.]|nr:hemerythrin domain-containing protein [Rhizobacter sp.]
MPTLLPGATGLAAGYDQPFEMLEACHARVQRSLNLLRRLVDHLRDHTADAMSADAALDVLRYFDLAAPAHHEDEERHVFPLLEASGKAELIALVHQLRSEHRQIEAQWALLRQVLDGVAQRQAVPWDELDRLASGFVALHAGHVAAEDQTAFPVARSAAQAKGPDALQAIGQEMAQRRGVTWPPEAAAPADA